MEKRSENAGVSEMTYMIATGEWPDREREVLEILKTYAGHPEANPDSIVALYKKLMSTISETREQIQNSLAEFCNQKQ